MPNHKYIFNVYALYYNIMPNHNDQLNSNDCWYVATALLQICWNYGLLKFVEMTLQCGDYVINVSR